MANTPHRKSAIGVGTSAVQLSDPSNSNAAYATPSASTDSVTSVRLCNKLGTTDIVVDVYVVTPGGTVYWQKSLQILAGATEELCDSNARPVFGAGDALWFVSNVAASLDVFASFLNNT